MQKRAFKQVDVFTLEPYQGNPVAVVIDGAGLSPMQMQQIARWTKMPETTFVLPPSDPRAAYQVRIFTPHKELAFAGHPTLATAHALLEGAYIDLRDGVVVQQCGEGLVTLDVEQIGDEFILYFTQSPAKVQPVPQTLRVALMKALGDIEIGAAWQVDVGPVWLTLQLENAAVVRQLNVDLEQIAQLNTKTRTFGVTVFGEQAPGGDSQFEVRSFAPATGVPENHVSATGNGCVAWIVQQENLITGNAYTASQGSCVAHDGMVNVLYQPDGRILIGGHSITCINGTLLA